MYSYSKYKINQDDQFLEDDFPNIQKEIASLQTELSSLPPYFKTEIIISYLKDHCIKIDWVKANPELTELVTSGALSTSHVEALFEASRDNKLFKQQLENYLTHQIDEAPLMTF